MAAENEGIQVIKPGTEFSTCPKCGYAKGFHSAYLDASAGKPTPVKSTKKVYRVLLICPECGAQYDIGLKTSLSEDCAQVVTVSMSCDKTLPKSG